MDREVEFRKVQSTRGKRIVPYSEGRAVNDFCESATAYYYTCEEDGAVRQFDSPDVHLATEFIHEVDNGD